MKRMLRYAILCFWLAVMCASCETKEHEFKLTILLNEKVDSSMIDVRAQVIRLCSYINDTATLDTVFIPQVSVVRMDYTPVRTEVIKIPLSGMNKFRRSLGLKSVKQLVNDYDKELPHLKLPGNMSLPSQQPQSLHHLLAAYPGLKVIKIDSVLEEHVDQALKEITAEIRKKPTSQFIILFSKPADVNDIETTPVLKCPVAGTDARRDTIISGIKYKLLNDGNCGFKRQLVKDTIFNKRKLPMRKAVYKSPGINKLPPSVPKQPLENAGNSGFRIKRNDIKNDK